MENILASLGDILKGIDFQTLLSSIMETVKKMVEMLKPLLSNLTAGTGTTDPSTPATTA